MSCGYYKLNPCVHWPWKFISWNHVPNAMIQLTNMWGLWMVLDGRQLNQERWSSPKLGTNIRLLSPLYNPGADPNSDWETSRMGGGFIVLISQCFEHQIQLFLHQIFNTDLIHCNYMILYEAKEWAGFWASPEKKVNYTSVINYSRL